MKGQRRRKAEGPVCYKPWISEHPIMTFFIATNIMGNLVWLFRGYDQ